MDSKAYNTVKQRKTYRNQYKGGLVLCIWRNIPVFTWEAVPASRIFPGEGICQEDQSLWDDIFMKVMGTPDVKQIDGMGGTVSSTSKVAIISKSDRRM